MKKTPFRHAERFVVLAAGTFDGLHAGHLQFLEFARGRAAKRASGRRVELRVIVARDSNAGRKRGRLPVHPQTERLKLVQSLRQVDAAFVGSEGNFVESVRKARPDLVIFGHDQEAALEKRLKALGYAVERAPPFQRHRLSSTRLRSKKFVEKH